MRDLQMYAKECMEYLDVIGIEYGNIIEFVPNTGATKRWGQCRAIPGGYSINISTVLLDERNDEEGLINTIIHELLHSCKGCMNHGENWKRLANKVYREYGLNIKRTSSAAEKGVIEETRPIKVKHKFVCKGCGQVITRQKESDFTKRYDRYTCAVCHSHFEKIF